MKNLRRSELADSIGVSVYSNDEFEHAIAHREIDIIQIPFNILDNYNSFYKVNINQFRNEKTMS